VDAGLVEGDSALPQPLAPLTTRRFAVVVDAPLPGAEAPT
jgi:hypothetical protein